MTTAEIPEAENDWQPLRRAITEALWNEQLILPKRTEIALVAAVDQRLVWIAEPFDESGYRHVHVWFGGEPIAEARFHWNDLLAETAQSVAELVSSHRRR